MSRGDSRIAKILQEARTLQGLSQRELSQRSGLTQAQISRIENGEVDLRLSSLIALVNVLEIDLVLTPVASSRPFVSRRTKQPRARRQAPVNRPVYQAPERRRRPGLFGDITDELL